GRSGQAIWCVYGGVLRYDQAGNLSDSSGGPFLRQLALPIADQCTTRHVGTRNALNGRLLVRPRVQIGFDANRDNGMQLRFLLRHWCVAFRSYKRCLSYKYILTRQSTERNDEPPTGYLHGCCAAAKAKAFRWSERGRPARTLPAAFATSASRHRTALTCDDQTGGGRVPSHR